MNEGLNHFEKQRIDLEESARELLIKSNINKELCQFEGDIEAMMRPLQGGMKKNQEWQYNISLYSPNNVYNKYQDKIEALTAIYKTICPQHHQDLKQCNKEDQRYKKVLEKVKQLQLHYQNLNLSQLIDKAKFFIISQQNIENFQKISTLGFVITELINLSSQYRNKMEEAKSQYQSAQQLILRLQQEVKMKRVQLQSKTKQLSEILESINRMAQSTKRSKSIKFLQQQSQDSSSIWPSSFISKRKIRKESQQASKCDHRSSLQQSFSLYQSQQQKIHFKPKSSKIRALSLDRFPQQQLSNFSNHFLEYKYNLSKQYLNMPLNDQESSCSNWADQNQSSKVIFADQPNQKKIKKQQFFEQLDISLIIYHNLSEQSSKEESEEEEEEEEEEDEEEEEEEEQEECWDYQLPEFSNRSAKEPAKNPISHHQPFSSDEQQEQSIVQSLFRKQAAI